ncbi:MULTISPECIES: integrase [Romboutsia]|nr:MULTISPECIES: integrase [Romboutsia]MCH1960166.1 integrase [Romboutsia hominis]MCH1969399.1 integrase [Romboutsia hominis]
MRIHVILYKKMNLKHMFILKRKHTNVTLVLLSGTNIKTVVNRLGHSDIKISMNKYSHVLEEMDKETSINLSNILFK